MIVIYFTMSAVFAKLKDVTQRNRVLTKKNQLTFYIFIGDNVDMTVETEGWYSYYFIAKLHFAPEKIFEAQILITKNSCWLLVYYILLLGINVLQKNLKKKDFHP